MIINSIINEGTFDHWDIIWLFFHDKISLETPFTLERSPNNGELKFLFLKFSFKNNMSLTEIACPSKAKGLLR